MKRAADRWALKALLQLGDPWPSAVFVVALVFALVRPPAPAAASGQVVLGGIVVDESGGAVAGASVTAATAAWTVACFTDDVGAFRLELPEASDLELVVAAPNFRPVSLAIAQADISRSWRVVLPVAGLAEQVTVTASRAESRADQTAAAVTTISRATLISSPGSTLDAVLRQVPGFTLFRRTDSRAANPTAQGVSLRGLGASGASRALVLDDGIPLNDPFGGWVYWDRVPRGALQRIEVMRGAASDLYGSGALGGVVNLIRRPVAARALELEVSYGTLGTRQVAGQAAAQIGGWSVRGDVEAATTLGWVPVEASTRGPVDRPAGRRYVVGEASVERAVGGAGHVWGRVSLFGESRDNGTVLQQNTTRAGQLSAGGQWATGRSLVAVRAHWSDHSFSQSFSAVDAARESERETLRQHVPATAAGASAQWTTARGSHLIVAGLEGRQVSGASFERSPGSDAAWQIETEAGGLQRGIGLFVGDTIRLAPPLTFAAGVRLDSVSNDRGRSITKTEGVVTARRDDERRRESAFSPRVSIVVRPTAGLDVTASAYRAFRAPTLNELYRSFRVGDIVTSANPGLVAERLTGAEAGVRAWPLGARVVAGARFFWMELDRPVANVTLETRPGLILRSRQNLGRIRSRGAEIDLEADLATGFRGRAGYAYDEATITRFEADPRLVGRAVPQQPRHTIAAGVEFARARVGSFALQARWLSPQFDDDQNRFRLAACSSLDASASRAIGPTVVFVAAENLTGSRCETGRTPVTTLGAPRAVRAGLRLRLADR